MRHLFLLLLPLVLCAQTAPSPEAKPYDDPEAYAVYSAILASDKPAEKAIMEQRTLVFDDCYQPDEHWQELLPVMENYKMMNQTRWDLVDSNIIFPHKLVSADEIRELFAKGPKRGWKRFYRKYPHKALLSVSAVGFNHDKTVAMVATESACGALCGASGLSFLRKVDGAWKKFEPTGTICVVQY